MCWPQSNQDLPLGVEPTQLILPAIGALHHAHHRGQCLERGDGRLRGHHAFPPLLSTTLARFIAHHRNYGTGSDLGLPLWGKKSGVSTLLVQPLLVLPPGATMLALPTGATTACTACRCKHCDAPLQNHCMLYVLLRRISLKL